MPELDHRLSDVYNHRLDTITPSQIRSFSREIQDIPGLVSLNVGEPGFNTPEHVKQAAIDSIANNQSHYSPQNGWLELREAISNYLKNRYQMDYDPEAEVTVTDGATEALSSSFLATINPGDEVLIPMPGYPAYTSLVELAGGVPVGMDTSATEFKLTPKQLEETLATHPDAKELVLNYPTNPTGVSYTKEELEQLAKVVAKHGLLVVDDEIYGELTYDIEHFSFAKLLPENTILINGLSKSHAMTGYRLGYVAGPAAIVTDVNKVHGYLVTSPSNPAQYAAIEALNNGMEDPIPMRKAYRERRDLMTTELRKLGFGVVTPEGAFYIFAKIPAQFKENSREFALRLAREAKVGVTPGSAFGVAGEGYLRLSYAADLDQIEKALAQMKTFIENNQ
ncbi:aminotransferase class I/II-fold pyridoxal phosphate-dependent enzyme [Fructilactobacillus cliffordii]|uniref:Aminotransferase n=1 Tax=Fructilactobacillus cliffordii TaxID=2940299 RepID=A0A9Q8ZU98_9LACO|nr:aminotransferase class I/II-fold pyridoxal phosphate-dependent enzyme [Fructilactobacillus cliffordii]USS86520.1 aminotransferase class I/II-fold pyridoxal phosphate-dependent enzyme [Fructilactobacillus cliffordii]USS89520.1 aminotransferase class I/II-fold pyridoxal phosphate-dependent enzyme [Fructilactobacillus cliffordii]